MTGYSLILADLGVNGILQLQETRDIQVPITVWYETSVYEAGPSLNALCDPDT